MLNIEELYKEYESGISIQEVADKHKIGMSTLYQHFTISNLKIRNRGDYKKEDVYQVNPNYIRKLVYFHGKRMSSYNKIYCEYHKINFIPKGFCVHHKDGNHSNDKIENLELISLSDHMRYHRNNDIK